MNLQSEKTFSFTGDHSITLSNEKKGFEDHLSKIAA